MVWKTERKTEPKTGNKGKETTRQGITNSSSDVSDVVIFDTMRAKNLDHGL
jgi:hypothetical protein